ncbi:DUF5329 family protein [Candidatus Venteria ishoeyi]|uniref:Lysozyme inhibitor LprI N-terminal domain-containing protein n=1 Tax=Candidatus Venteria ishoeyi TaxID=1899563 RepID=A0A1H6FD55_9GAMM|nr:DUF5329 family protein [Candidatus Venteria ishoeyi]MDM8546142.1 DUF5329 family protein [Candidatus Venteria ishoeyi]SEH08008.1 Uncharacterised protein [Candidatus Venteria ishoeyi]
MTRKLITLLGFMLLSAPAFADVPVSQQAEVKYLLDFIKNSECLMERNGKRHAGIEALAHIQKKYKHFKDKIQSTEDFIQYSASQSTLTSKQYIVHCTAAKTISSQQWLLNALKSYRSGTGIK